MLWRRLQTLIASLHSRADATGQYHALLVWEKRMKNHDRHHAATCIMTPKRNRGRQSRQPKPRRCGLARLRSAFFARAGEGATRYSVSFERVLKHLWAARRGNSRLFVRMVAHVDDLVLTIGCVDGDGRAWSDLAELYERSLARRGRHCPDDLESTVQARRFIASLRRDSLAGHSALAAYAGTRPLRSWMADLFMTTRQRSRRAAFVLDPADSCCGTPLRFRPSSGTG